MRKTVQLSRKGRFRKRAVLANVRDNRMGVFERGRGSCNSSFVLKANVAIASEVLISSKVSLVITDFLAKRTQLANYCRKLPSWNPAIREIQNAPLFRFLVPGNIGMYLPRTSKFPIRLFFFLTLAGRLFFFFSRLV